MEGNALRVFNSVQGIIQRFKVQESKTTRFSGVRIIHDRNLRELSEFRVNLFEVAVLGGNS